jgi:hypothetical protein
MGNFVPGCRSGWPTACTMPGRVCAVVDNCVIESDSTGVFDARSSTELLGLASTIRS